MKHRTFGYIALMCAPTHFSRSDTFFDKPGNTPSTNKFIGFFGFVRDLGIALRDMDDFDAFEIS